MSEDATFADETVLSRAQAAWLIVAVGWAAITAAWLASGNILGWVAAVITLGSVYQLLHSG